MKKSKGFTLMELIVVLAILAILAAILIPTFLRTTDRARLRADVQSARVLNNALDLYRLERGRMPSGNGAAEIIRALHEAGYLPSETIIPQTNGAYWLIDPNNVIVLDIRGLDFDNLFNDLTSEEQQFVLR